LTRLDLVEASVETIYVIVWASANVSLHMGKIENADEVSRNHVGIRLQVSLSLFSYLRVCKNRLGKKPNRFQNVSFSYPNS